jgi:predicted transcriptional regulator of viral defense system
MSDKFQHQKTLGPVSAQFITALKTAGKSIFTLQDTQQLTGKNPKQAAQFISDLVKRSLIARLNVGLYLILETGKENTQLRNWPLVAKALAGNNTYYVSHYAAMRLHGMTTHPLVEISITLPKRRGKKKINNIIYRFTYTKDENFWGIESKWVSKEESVYLSDLERTILDGLNHPEYCGGISEVINGIWLKQKELGWKKLVTYAKRFPKKAPIKRLGYILETLGIGTSHLPILQEIVADAKDYVLLDPLGEKTGAHLKRCYLRLNISTPKF